MCWARNDLGYLPHRWSERSSGRTRREESTLRVSDADRQAVIERLRSHTAEGRLTLEEFEERVEEALLARTGGDLQVVLRDLPSSPVPFARNVPHWLLNPFVIAGAVIAVVSLAAGNLVLWPLLVAVGLCVFGGWHRRAAPDVQRQITQADQPIRRHDEFLTGV
jgi:hypothetical protein